MDTTQSTSQTGDGISRSGTVTLVKDGREYEMPVLTDADIRAAIENNWKDIGRDYSLSEEWMKSGGHREVV